jgi:mitochondrial chaperone BCS1
MQRERETKAMHLMTHTPWETITITALSKDRGLFIDLLTEARELSSRQKEGKLTIHTAWGTEWRPFGKPRRKRPLDSVVLADGVSERLSVDLKSFLGRRQWYTQRGICSTFSQRVPSNSCYQVCHTDADTYFMVLQALGNHLTFRH